MLNYVNHSYLADMIGIAFTIVKRLEETSTEYKDMGDDVIIGKFSTIIYQLCCFCSEEMTLRAESDLKPKIDSFMSNNYKILKDIALYLLQQCFSKDIKQRYFVFAVNILFSIFTLSDTVQPVFLLAT